MTWPTVKVHLYPQIEARVRANMLSYHNGEAGTTLGDNLVTLIRQIGNAN